MATVGKIGVNEAGRAAAETITVLMSAKLGKKLTYSQAFIETEKLVRAAIAAEAKQTVECDA